jgi:serine/threonine protein kinase
MGEVLNNKYLSQKDGSGGIPHFILREISSLSDLKGCPNIVELLDVFEVRGSKKIILSFKFEKGGDLNYLLHKQSKYFS